MLAFYFALNELWLSRYLPIQPFVIVKAVRGMLCLCELEGQIKKAQLFLAAPCKT